MTGGRSRVSAARQADGAAGILKEGFRRGHILQKDTENEKKKNKAVNSSHQNEKHWNSRSRHVLSGSSSDITGRPRLDCTFRVTVFACLKLIAWCLSACVQRVSCEALKRAHNDSIHRWLCVTQQLQLLIPHAGFLFNRCCSVQAFNYHSWKWEKKKKKKGECGKPPQEIRNILSSTGGQVETDRKETGEPGNRGTGEPTVCTKPLLNSSEAKQEKRRSSHMTDKTATYCQREAVKQSARLHGSCGRSQSGRPPPSSRLLSLTTLPFPPSFPSFPLLLCPVQQSAERRRESAERQEKG